MVVTREVVIQSIAQAMGILFVTCRRDFEILQDLISQFINGRRC